MRAAYTRSPLTHDFERIEVTLQFIANAGSDGGTDMAAGVRLGFIELNGLSGARSEARDGAAKLMFFFTDGVPTAPFPFREEGKNVAAVLEEAQRAELLGVVVHSFAVGRTAIEKPIAVVELSDVTRGTFTAVRDPGVLSAIVQTVDFANLEEVAVRSVTNGSYADPLWIGADGSWGGLLKLGPGLNQVEVIARAPDGTRVVQRTTAFAEVGPSDADLPDLPTGLAARRHRLLEECLEIVRRERIAAERGLKQKIRRDLVLEIERERAAARQRAGEQRKTLILEVGDEEPEVPEP